MYACLYQPPQSDASRSQACGLGAVGPQTQLDAIAADFSPRYERRRDDLVVIDVGGLERLLGPADVIGEELRRSAAGRGSRIHIAIAGTQTAALVLALARPGVTVVERGGEGEALAPIALGFLAQCSDAPPEIFSHWGLRTLGELAALPGADLVSRLGRGALVWQAIARGEDIRPLIPTLPEERFVSSLELEWPIEGLEPLSFVLTRLLEPLSARLERRDRGAAVLHVLLGLVTRAPDAVSSAPGTSDREVHMRRLELPSPLRDVRALRTLALLDLESHPPAAAIDRVTVVIDPTPARVLQHTLYTRPHPTPEQLSTLLARLGALMGQDRIGAATTLDTYRPGAFGMTPFQTEHGTGRPVTMPPGRSSDVAALRRCRQAVPARVAVADGRPVRVTTDRRGYAGGRVIGCAGPWRTSGEWWVDRAGGPHAWDEVGRGPHAWDKVGRGPHAWDKDEWDVALDDGAVYRIFRDRGADRWFIDAIVD